jgi:hypothetical protein
LRENRAWKPVAWFGQKLAMAKESLWPTQLRREDWIQPMLQKCANPGCSVPFRSLHEGKLFLAETFVPETDGGVEGGRRKIRRREHFWLCAACSAHFTLHFDTSRGMLTVPISNGAGRRLGVSRAACASTA